MALTALTVRVDVVVKRQLENLAKKTGRSQSLIAAEAISADLDVNEWQIAGIKRAIDSMDRGDGIPHERVKEWISSWGCQKELAAPKHRRR
jgi:predicted transcriptional regulator